MKTTHRSTRRIEIDTRSVPTVDRGRDCITEDEDDDSAWCIMAWVVAGFLDDGSTETWSVLEPVGALRFLEAVDWARESSIDRISCGTGVDTEALVRRRDERRGGGTSVAEAAVAAPALHWRRSVGPDCSPPDAGIPRRRSLWLTVLWVWFDMVKRGKGSEWGGIWPVQ